MKEKIRCVGYVKPMDSMEILAEDKRIPAIDEKLQKEHIYAYAEQNGLSISKMYVEEENEDFSCDKEFKRLRDDAIHRKFDMLIVDSVYCFGALTYIAADILVNVFFPAGIRFAVLEDEFFSTDKTMDEVKEYGKAVWRRYRSRQALLTKKTGRLSVVTRPWERRNDRPDCILNLLPAEKREKCGLQRRGNGKRCFDDPSIQRQLHDLVMAERKRAEYAKSKLPDAAPVKREFLSEYVEETERLWDRMAEYNRLFVQLYAALSMGEILKEQYDTQYSEYMKICAEIEDKYKQCRKDMFEIERLFDTENLWIKRFIVTALPEKFNQDNTVRWFKAFDIIDGKVTNVKFTYWEWRDALPAICRKNTEE